MRPMRYGLPLILRGRLAWAHDFVNNPALNPAFESLPGASFTVNGAQIPHDSALTTAGAELFITPRWTLLAKFDGEFANGSHTYTGSGTLSYSGEGVNASRICAFAPLSERVGAPWGAGFLNAATATMENPLRIM